MRFVTSDKYIWLFGRIFPAAGLVLSCAIRFLPMFIRTSREFAAVQNVQSIRGRLRAFSASVGYSAERAMDSALSMKARGYGTSPRTSFSIYRFTEYTAGFHGGSACRPPEFRLFSEFSVPGNTTFYPRFRIFRAERRISQCTARLRRCVCCPPQ